MQAIRIGHSPDPDDAFMFYALTADKVRIPGVTIEHVLEDIETLNRRSRAAELEVTAVAGKHTTSALLLHLYVGDPPLIEVAFDKIPTAVLEGQADLGLLIHEGQITYQKMGLTKVLDLGEAWQRDTGLPLPLGCNVMRRDLGDDLHRALSTALKESIAWAHAHVDEALEYAMRYGRGIDKETCRRFVLMYVNDFTLALGHEGRPAIERLFTMARDKSLVSAVPPIDPV